MKTTIFLFLFILFTNTMVSQTVTVNLWNVIPNSQPTDEEEYNTFEGKKRIHAIKKPTIDIHLPTSNSVSDKSVIIFPGGGYRILAYDWEGTDIAKWLNNRGITAFVVKYRIPTSKSVITSHEAPLQDAQRAIRWVRFNAKKWNINPNKIGIMGFSAGGHLASTLGTQYATPNNFNEEPLDSVSARPNFMALVYPVIKMQGEGVHIGSRKNLLGENSSEALNIKFSNELNVTKDTPPTFLVHTADDKSVPVENSLVFYKALIDHKVKAEMHLYPYGGHGFSMALDKGYLKTWIDRFGDWLDNL